MLSRYLPQTLDGSKSENGWTKAKLGANAILGVSMALCRAGAAAAGVPLYQYIARLAGKSGASHPTLLLLQHPCSQHELNLHPTHHLTQSVVITPIQRCDPAETSFTHPVPFMNVINGGAHAGNGLAFQEFMVRPKADRPIVARCACWCFFAIDAGGTTTMQNHSARIFLYPFQPLPPADRPHWRVLLQRGHAHGQRGVPQPGQDHQGQVRRGLHQRGRCVRVTSSPPSLFPRLISSGSHSSHFLRPSASIQLLFSLLLFVPFCFADEGGFAPNIADAYEGLNLLVEAIAKAGYEGKVKVAMDVAASEFASEAKPPTYDIKKKSPTKDGTGVKTGAEMIAMYSDMAAKYPIVSIEDPFDQDDWTTYEGFTAAIGGPVQVVGDDLLVSVYGKITA